MEKDQTNFFDEISLVSNDVKVEAAMYSYSVLLKFMCQFCAVFRFLLDLNRIPRPEIWIYSSEYSRRFFVYFHVLAAHILILIPNVWCDFFVVGRHRDIPS